jgi:tetratricopeptide (TPR) repeat protein
MSSFSDPNEQALALKSEGNELIKECKYGQAASKYTEAIALCPSAVLYSNRAQAYIKMESYGVAIQDADEAIRYVIQSFYYRNNTISFHFYYLKSLFNEVSIF